MPSFPIIDTHLHLWDPEYLTYPWLNDVPSLNKSYLLDDYNQATKGIAVDKMVFVQCECQFSQFEDEALWVTKLAASDNRIQAIIPWAPLENGVRVKDVLDRFSDNKLIKGIRRIIQFEPNPEFCLQPDFIRGVQILAEYDMTFDICISHLQLKNTIKLVKACPDVQFILDHIGKPDIKNQYFEPWRTGLKELSNLENVCCKISGLVTEADHKTWKKEDLSRYIDDVLEYFGVNRLMFGGDWPVVCQAANYGKWVETLDWALNGLSQNELKKIYQKNAVEFYRLA